MTDSLDDLVQRVLDGDATAEERGRLDAQLSADPQARARHEDMARVFQALKAARVEDPPAGMRDDILRAVRGAAPARSRVPARTGRPAFSWFRFALPIAGAAAALAVFLNWQGLGRQVAGDRVSGTMSGELSGGPLRLGQGGDAVTVRWAPSPEGGFRMVVQSGDAPARVVLEAVGEGTTLRLAESDPATSSPRLEAALPANSLVVAEGTSRYDRATVRVGVTLPGGQSSRGEVGLRGLRPPR